MANQNIKMHGESWVIDRTAISPYKKYCDGYMAPGAQGSGYVSVLKVETGVTKMLTDPLLDDIRAYDTAETNGAYIGQINMITASSFSGIAGQIWGYDLAQHDDIANNKCPVEFTMDNYDGSKMDCYDAKPLLDAGKRLFGTVDQRLYPLVPGAHTICANKNCVARLPASGVPKEPGEGYGVWSFISISIAKDRTKGANIFIEDAGIWTENKDPFDLKKYLENKKREMAACTIACGKNARVPYERSYIGYAYTMLQPGEVAMAVTVGPYVSLAQNAIPNEGFDQLNQLTLSEWEKQQSI